MIFNSFINHDVVWVRDFEVAPEHLCSDPEHQQTGGTDTGEHTEPEVPVDPWRHKRSIHHGPEEKPERFYLKNLNVNMLLFYNTCRL